MVGLLKGTQYMRRLRQERFETIKMVYADGYALQMEVMIAFAGAAVVTELGAWKREWKIMEGRSEEAMVPYNLFYRCRV